MYNWWQTFIFKPTKIFISQEIQSMARFLSTLELSLLVPKDFLLNLQVMSASNGCRAGSYIVQPHLTKYLDILLHLLHSIQSLLFRLDSFLIRMYLNVDSENGHFRLWVWGKYRLRPSSQIYSHLCQSLLWNEIFLN